MKLENFKLDEFDGDFRAENEQQAEDTIDAFLYINSELPPDALIKMAEHIRTKSTVYSLVKRMLS